MLPTTRTRRLRRESWGFAIGSTLFALGAVPAFASVVGAMWGSATFFLGSIFFTAAGFIQLVLSGRRPPRNRWRSADGADWWAAFIQFLGTLLFNVSTFAVLLAATRDPDPAAGWKGDAWGSLAFLIASALAMIAAARRHELWDADARTWHGTILNMLGSIFFGVSAIGAYVLPGTDDLLSASWADAGTFLGAICFLVAALVARRNISTA